MDVITADTWSIIGGSIVTRIFISHLGHFELVPQPDPWGDLRYPWLLTTYDLRPSWYGSSKLTRLVAASCIWTWWIFSEILPTKRRKVLVSHTIHVWHIYLHLVDFYGKCIGKYTIHGSYGCEDAFSFATCREFFLRSVDIQDIH